MLLIRYYGALHDDVMRCDASIIVFFVACFKECDRLFGLFPENGSVLSDARGYRHKSVKGISGR